MRRRAACGGEEDVHSGACSLLPLIIANDLFSQLPSHPSGASPLWKSLFRESSPDGFEASLTAQKILSN